MLKLANASDYDRSIDLFKSAGTIFCRTCELEITETCQMTAGDGGYFVNCRTGTIFHYPLILMFSTTTPIFLLVEGIEEVDAHALHLKPSILGKLVSIFLFCQRRLGNL